MENLPNIFELRKDSNVSINLKNAKLPSNKDVFFRAKQEELLQHYESARIFLLETETDDWNHWFELDEKDKIDKQEIFELLYMERMFECSLMYYNIIVDLSWTLCYVSVEYVLYEKGKKININELMNIEDAYNTMRKAENLVSNPNGEDNPFKYLKKMCPEFEKAINLIVDFWKMFSETNIRNLYNFIKHKGRPLYEEEEKFKGAKAINLIIKNESCPTDIRDIQKRVSLKKSIAELKKFDDIVLFPYIKNLFELLEEAVNPSPFVF